MPPIPSAAAPIASGPAFGAKVAAVPVVPHRTEVTVIAPMANSFWCLTQHPPRKRRFSAPGLIEMPNLQVRRVLLPLRARTPAALRVRQLGLRERSWPIWCSGSIRLVLYAPLLPSAPELLLVTPLRREDTRIRGTRGCRQHWRDLYKHR